MGLFDSEYTSLKNQKLNQQVSNNYVEGTIDKDIFSSLDFLNGSFFSLTTLYEA